MASSQATVAILSLREIRPVANYGGLREAEDALVEALGAGLYRVLLASPRFSRGALAKPAVRTLLNSSRVVHPYRIEHHQRHGGAPSDVLLVLARDLGDASVLVGLPDWHTLGSQVLVHIETVTDWDLRRYAEVVTHLRKRADALFAGCEMPPLTYLRTLHGKLHTVDVVPPMLDVLAFPVRTDPLHRTIDVFCPGRVPAGQHELLRQWAQRNEGSYQHDIGQLGAVTSLDQHRKIFTSMATRARLFLTNHHRYGGRDGTHRGVDTRFFEAMAAGCALVGDLPVGSRLFAEFVAPAEPLGLKADAEELPRDVLAALDDPERSQELGAIARATALRRNDVAHRWRQLAELTGVPVAPGIEARIAELAVLAEHPSGGASSGG
ncbi:MAG: glycosyltransferase [Pseudonocardia sp.]